jgi:signal transduction histidine kinase
LDIANGNSLKEMAIGFVTCLAYPAMGLLIIRQQPRNAIGWLLLGIGLNTYVLFIDQGYAVFALIRHPGTLPAAQLFVWLGMWAWLPFILMLLLFLPMLFPDGRLLSPRWRIVILAGFLFALLSVVGSLFSTGTVFNGYPAITNPLANAEIFRRLLPLRNLSALPLLFFILGAIASVVVRYRRADSLQRHQLRWFLFTLPLVATPFALHGFSSFLEGVAAVLFVSLLPISIAVAVLRYRLYDIDVVINRALVYGALAGFITAVYVGIVVGAGRVIGSGSRPNLGLSIVATAVVAVAFQPVRERVQHLANRLVYGKRATPYEVMADFSERMSETLAPNEVLLRMAEAAARGVGAAAARVGVNLPDGSDQAIWWPSELAVDALRYRVPVKYHEQLVGEIAAAKTPGAPITSSEAKLLNDLAAQAGLVLHNVRLTAELQARLDELTAQADTIRASRQRLVTAATVERQRLEQTISGGVAQQLAALASKLTAVDPVLDADPEQAAAALTGLTADVQQTLDALRQVAHRIYPPLLRDQGLVPALRAQTSKALVPVDVVCRSVGRYAAEVEAAVYFSCLEALRFAEGTSLVTVTGGEGALHFEISAPGSTGNALQAIEDRVEALGGSLTVDHGRIIGLVPICVPEAVA